MNNVTEYRTATDNIRFTDAQKEQLTAALTRSAPPTRIHSHPVRAGLVAAAICIMLVGSALAVTVLHSAGIITPFSAGDKKEELGIPNPGYTVTYETGRLPLSEFSDRILTDAAGPDSGSPTPFESWEEAEEYIGFNLMDNGYLDRAQRIDTPHLLEGNTRTHAVVTRGVSDGVLTSAIAYASYCVTENGVPVRIDLEAIVYTEQKPADADISQWNVLFVEESPDLILSEITGSNGLTASLAANPHEIYPTCYSAYFAANGVAFMFQVQYDWQNNTLDHETANAAAAAAVQALMDGFSF